jgi:hypothetical protein
VTDSDSNDAEWVSLNGSGRTRMEMYYRIRGWTIMEISYLQATYALRVGVHTIALTVQDSGGLTRQTV